MTVLTAKTNISDTYPLPNNATARTAMGNIWDVINEFTGKSEIDVASAATIDIGAQLSTKLRITGTTGPVTSLGIVYRGPILVRIGSSGGVFTHNATTLKCPGAVNYSGVAGDVLLFSPIASVSGVPDGWQLVILQGVGALNMIVGAAIASAATINLTTATGNLVHITGNTGIGTVILGAGMTRTVIFDGAPLLTHHATNNNLPGAANITAAVDDRATYVSDGTTVYCINYTAARAVTFNNVVNQAVGAAIASAATINLTTATGNLVHITGNTGIGTVTLGAGMSRTVIFDGTPLLTHHATNNNLPGGVSTILVAAGDRATYISDGTTVYLSAFLRSGSSNPTLTQRAIFAYGLSSVSVVSISNLVSNTGVVASDTTGVGTARRGTAGAGYGTDKAIFAYGTTGTVVSISNLVSNTGVVASDTAGVGTARRYPAAAGYGTDKAIFAYGSTGSYVSISNLVSNTGVVASDTTGVGTAREGTAGAGYGTDKAIVAYGTTGTVVSMSNLVSNTGVVASDTTGVGTARRYIAAAGYGTDKAIFAYGSTGSVVSISNLVSNTGVVASDTTGVGTAREAPAAAGYGTDKAIFAYGFSTVVVSISNLVSNTGVVASDTTGVGTARESTAAAGYSLS